MKKLMNESGMDRVIRVFLGLVLLVLGWGGIVTGGWGVFFKIIGFIPLITGLIGVCPAYMLLNMRTNKKELAEK